MDAALYARGSVPSGGVGAQLESLRQHCRDQGWDIQGEYVDEALGIDAATHTELRRLLGDARAGKFNAVVVCSLDRVSRSERKLGEIRTALEALGIGFYHLR